MKISLQQLANNFSVITIDNTQLWFSYETCVALRTNSSGLIVSENIWSRTTGKHLNSLSTKKDRVTHEKFSKLLEKTFNIY